MSDLVSRIERELAQREDDNSKKKPPVWSRWLIGGTALLLSVIFLAEVFLRIVWTPTPRLSANSIPAISGEGVSRLNARFGDQVFQADDKLLWKLRPGASLDGLPVNEEGLAGASTPTFPVGARGADALRILVLGDSVPALSYRTFPSLVQRYARAVPEAPNIVTANASIPGYSTLQGITWYEKLKPLQCQAVIICFGLADRSPALNLPDRFLLGTGQPKGSWLTRLFPGSRLVSWLGAPTSDRWRARPDVEKVRVSPDAYKQNLVTLAQAVRDQGAIPILATQPLRRTAQQASPDLVLNAAKYNEAVRRAAEESGTAILDLDEEFSRRDRETLLDLDGVHLTGPGHALVARLLIAQFRELALLKPEAVKAIAEATRYDSAAPDKVRAEWRVHPKTIETAPTETTASVGILVRNIGNTRWLRSHIVDDYRGTKNLDYGGVFIAARWLTAGASNSIEPAAVQALPQDVLPGESTSITLTLRTPHQAGVYHAELGLSTLGYGDLSRIGATTATLSVIRR